MEQEEPEDEYDDDKYDENGNEEMRIRANDVDDQVHSFLKDLNHFLTTHLQEESDVGDENPDEPVGARPRRVSNLPQKQAKPIPKASSLFILSNTNTFRVFCNKIVNHSIFTNAVLVCILVSFLRGLLIFLS